MNNNEDIKKACAEYAKARKREYMREYAQRPEVKERKREYMRKLRAKQKEEASKNEQGYSDRQPDQ